MPMTSDSFMIISSSPSRRTSVPDHLPNSTRSPALRSSGCTLPSSPRAPGPTAMTSPSIGFSWAVSGMMIPPLVLASCSSRRITTRSCNGLNFMKIRPLHDRVVIRREEQEAKTRGGIIIPDTAQEKPMEGEVIAVGPGARGEDGKVHPLDLKAGDRVLFGKWSGTEVRLDGEELMIMKESDVMGIVDSGAAAAKTT